MTITADHLPNLPGAACRATPDPEVFFPATSGGRPSKWEQLLWDEAAEMCSHCPVRVQCLEWALEHDELGIWGGTTDEQRRRMRRKPLSREVRRRHVRSLHGEGLRDPDIAATLGVSRSVVQHDRIALGLVEHFNTALPERREKVRELHALGFNDREISARIDATRDQVRNDRILLGLKQNYHPGGAA